MGTGNMCSVTGGLIVLFRPGDSKVSGHSRIRSWVEHILGIQAQHAGSLIGGSTGVVRARTEIGLRNLPCNLD